MKNRFLSTLEHKAKRIKEDIVVLYLAVKDERVPLVAKCIIVLVVGYALSPIDLIPDFIPILGYLDDIILLPLGIYLAVQLIPPLVLSDLRKKAKTVPQLKQNKIAAAIIVATWIIIAVVLTNYLLLSSK